MKSELTVRRYSPTWGTHIPVLIRALEISQGPVLELGVGVWSTPVLHMMCENSRRMLHSYEDDPEWYKAHRTFITKRHSVSHVERWERVPIEGTHWGVVFVDHAAHRRAIDAWRARGVADYVMIHDSNAYNDRHYHYDRIYPAFKYRYNFRRLTPNTTVLSNFKDLSLL